ncbi:hypothetical protein SUGI_0545630 [Cryptomeria japonica]|nr:hypothetical protein SUGI_0545630 [Cryptomeria japonica]
MVSSNTGSAFDAIIPSTSTFVASSSGTRHLPYDIFINHCEKGVKNSLVTRIYDSLDATGLRVFLDKDELELGDLLPKALQEATESASLHIVIFSKHWSLAELAFMVESSIPIFYYVEPSDLRWVAVGRKQKYGDDFLEHENTKR